MNKFKLPIGDYSDDDHGKCIYYIIESNKSLEEVRELYFKSCELFGNNFSKYLCWDYGDNYLTEDHFEELSKFGIDFTKIFIDINDILDEFEAEENINLDIESYVEILLQFIKISDSDLELKIIEDKLPMFNFYGKDDKGRHIGQFGYGLL